MLVVKTKLNKDNYDGIGLFANEDIKEGDIVYIKDALSHILISKDSLDKSPKLFRDCVIKYATFINGKYFLDLDDTRFINHSSEPNIEFTTISNEGFANAIALVNILKGTELTCDYTKLSEDDKELGF